MFYELGYMDGLMGYFDETLANEESYLLGYEEGQNDRDNPLN